MMIGRCNWLSAAVQIGLLAWSGTTLAADQVYVANEGADTVSVLDAESLNTLTNVRVGKMPHNVQVSPDGKLVWVTNNGEPDQVADVSAHKGMAQGDHDAMGKPGAIWAIDTATNTVVAKVPVGMHPAHVVVSPDGRFAYVTNGGDNPVTDRCVHGRIVPDRGEGVDENRLIENDFTRPEADDGQWQQNRREHSRRTGGIDLPAHRSIPITGQTAPRRGLLFVCPSLSRRLLHAAPVLPVLPHAPEPINGKL